MEESKGIQKVIQEYVLEDVREERERQDLKWGDQIHNTNELWNVIGVEEVGEVARAIYEADNVEHLYTELIQVAAVYVAWAESLKRWEETCFEKHG